jgi:hypothetical protein
MKIDKVLFTCNENVEYTGFWNSISKFYSTKIGITPVLYFIGNPDNYGLSNEFGEIRKINPVRDVSTRIQALWAKFYFTKDEPNTTWLIGDLDLYHFDKSYFDLPENYDYYHLNERAYNFNVSWVESKDVDLPGYYHVAKGSTFTEIYNLNDSFEDQVNYIKNSKKYGIGFNNKGWTHHAEDGHYQCCEENLSTEIMRTKLKQLRFYGKTLRDNSRLDRELILAPLDNIKTSIKNKLVVDMHCPRPYEKYQERIETILDLI